MVVGDERREGAKSRHLTLKKLSQTLKACAKGHVICRTVRTEVRVQRYHGGRVDGILSIRGPEGCPGRLGSVLVACNHLRRMRRARRPARTRANVDSDRRPQVRDDLRRRRLDEFAGAERTRHANDATRVEWECVVLLVCCCC